MKRQADKQLSKDDWEKQETSEGQESIVDTIASEKIIKERILKRAKLCGNTQVETESSPLKLFAQGFLTGQTSANKDFSIKATSSTKPTSSMIEDLSQDSAGSQDNSTKPSQANSVCSDDVSIPDYPDDAFSRNISRLNTAVSKWIASQVMKNPICDLTPIFSDYQRYFKEFNREAHPSPTASASPINNHNDTPYRPAQEVSAVTPAIESADKPVSSQSLRGLLFSNPSTQVHSFSSPSTQTSKPAASSMASDYRSLRFNPFTKPTKPSRPLLSTPPSSSPDPPLLKTGSCLGVLLQPVSSKKDDLSGQEAPTISTSATPVPLFSLSIPGVRPLATSATPVPLLSLSNPGVKPLATSATSVPLLSLSIPGVRPLATSSTFSFNPRPLPIFPSAPAFSELVSPRSMSLSLPQSSLGTFTAQKPASPDGDGEEGEDDRTELERPQTPPALKLDTENTVFTCNSKVFMKRSDSFADIGICILRVRKNPNSNKTQLLVRNNTTFARIIINIIITSTTPISKSREKEIIIICPKQETDSSDKDGGNQVLEMDTFLIRVKTPALASTLYALLDEAKRKTLIYTA